MARITKEVTGVNIEFAENGFVMDYSGRDDNGDYKSVKKVLFNFTDLTEHLADIIEMSEYK